MGLECDSQYEQQLIDYIHDLQDRFDAVVEENARLQRENDSYRLWQRRTIDRVKAMQK
jgi:hypothetical protein